MSYSYRQLSDTDATDDRTILSSAPDPTRAGNQVRTSPPLFFFFFCFEIGYLSPTYPSPRPHPHPDLRSLIFFPRLIGGLLYKLVRRRPRSPRALTSSSKSPSYQPATTYTWLHTHPRSRPPQGRAAGERFRACCRQDAVVSQEMGDCIDRLRHGRHR